MLLEPEVRSSASSSSGNQPSKLALQLSWLLFDRPLCISKCTRAYRFFCACSRFAKLPRRCEALSYLIYNEGYGGRGGIRTPDTLSGTPVFKTGAINHSATLPSDDNKLRSGIATDVTYLEGAWIEAPNLGTGKELLSTSLPPYQRSEGRVCGLRRRHEAL